MSYDPVSHLLSDSKPPIYNPKCDHAKCYDNTRDDDHNDGVSSITVNDTLNACHDYSCNSCKWNKCWRRHSLPSTDSPR